MNNTFNIAIFASGGGSNAAAILEHFKDNDKVKVGLIVTNNAHAGVISHANAHDVPAYIHSTEELKNGYLLQLLQNFDVDFIVLAGYLKLIPENLVRAYPHRIVNIHPALLPKFGGKGMYGMHVHKAVKEAGETVSGPTIHFVNEQYDEGDIIAQYKCDIAKEDTAEDIQKAVLKLEHQHYPRCIEETIKKHYDI